MPSQTSHENLSQELKFTEELQVVSESPQYLPCKSTTIPWRTWYWAVMLWAGFWSREVVGKTRLMQPTGAGILLFVWWTPWVIIMEGWRRVRDRFWLIKGATRLCRCCLFSSVRQNIKLIEELEPNRGFSDSLPSAWLYDSSSSPILGDDFPWHLQSY